MLIAIDNYCRAGANQVIIGRLLSGVDLSQPIRLGDLGFKASSLRIVGTGLPDRVGIIA